jgi:hypothetical protein
MVKERVNNKVLGFKMYMEVLVEVVSNNVHYYGDLQGSPAEYTGLILDHDGKEIGDTMELQSCPWCGQFPCDVSEVTEKHVLDAYLLAKVFPVACCNSECPVQPHTDNISWNQRPVPKYVVEEMKDALTKYVQQDNDVLVIPGSYLQQIGLTEEKLSSKGYTSIIFPGNILLKPAIIKTAGYMYKH